MAFDYLATHGLTLEALQSHALIVGPTRAGKTSRVIAPLVRQLMDHISPSRGANRHAASIVILDLKGDMGLFEGCRREATESKLVFRWFTPNTGESTYIWNPLRQSFLSRLRNEDIVQLILAGLSLDFGEDYGRHYFMSNILQGLREALQRNPVRSFFDLAQLMRDHPDLCGGNAVVRKAEHLVAVVQQMAAHPALNGAEHEPDYSPAGDQFRDQGKYGPVSLEWQIDIPQILRVPQVVYFWLPIKTVGVSSRAIGRLFVNELMAATERHVRKADEKNLIYLWVDEFHELVDRGDKLARLFAQARSNGVSCLVAHQSPAQTRTLGANLEEISRESVGLHIRMGMPSQTDMPQVQLEGGYVWNRTGISQNEMGISESYAEMPRLVPNRLLQMAATPGEALVRVREPDANGWAHPYGHAEFLQLSHHISVEEYRSRRDSPWPSLKDYPGTMLSLPESPANWTARPSGVQTPSPVKTKATAVKPTVFANGVQSASTTSNTSDYVSQFLERAAGFLEKLKQVSDGRVANGDTTK